MIGFLIPIFARWGIPDSLRKPLAWLAAILGAIALLAALLGLGSLAWHRWLSGHDKAVVSADRADAATAADNAALGAELSAGGNKAARDLDDQKQQLQRMEAINGAMADPDGDPWAAAFPDRR